MKYLLKKRKPFKNLIYFLRNFQIQDNPTEHHVFAVPEVALVAGDELTAYQVRFKI